MEIESYKDFRTGFTFKDIRMMLKYEAKRKYECGEYMFVTRHTVLGRWREIKIRMYNEYVDAIEEINDNSCIT